MVGETGILCPAGFPAPTFCHSHASSQRYRLPTHGVLLSIALHHNVFLRLATLCSWPCRIFLYAFTACEAGPLCGFRERQLTSYSLASLSLHDPLFSDHAGIATQLQVERALLAEGSSRVAIGRDAFLARAWIWKQEKGGRITEQMRRLGASADWSREKFTMDPAMSAAVTEAFVRLHDQGLVYRGNYLVNWAPQLQTAVSDLEVSQ
jgi:hypothetical protein